METISLLHNSLLVQIAIYHFEVVKKASCKFLCIWTYCENGFKFHYVIQFW